MNALNTLGGGPHAARAAAPPDWLALLRGGTLSTKGPEVTGIWPLDRAFLSGLFSAGGF
jgi:hypothetical protein